jgi:phosphoglycolate phosphatase
VRHLFFDLDGTLTDPRLGFVRSVQHALSGTGEPAPADELVKSFIGPPLEQTLRRLLGSRADAELAEAIRRYDERYATHGIYENSLYPGALAGLETLSARGWTIRIVTSKREDFARDVLEHCGLMRHVAAVVGFDASGSTTDKGRLLEALLAREGMRAEECWMIGDRSYDVIAARENGVRAIGVLWGYGSRSELVNTGAEVLAESWEQLVTLLGAPG